MSRRGIPEQQRSEEEVEETALYRGPVIINAACSSLSIL